MTDRAAALNRDIDRDVRAVSDRGASKSPRRRPFGVFRGRPRAVRSGPGIVHRRNSHPAGHAQHRDAGLGSVPQAQSRVCRAARPRCDHRGEPPKRRTSPNARAGTASAPCRSGVSAPFPPEVRDTIVRPGPRVADGMRAIADCLAKFCAMSASPRARRARRSSRAPVHTASPRHGVAPRLPRSDAAAHVRAVCDRHLEHRDLARLDLLARCAV